MQMRTSQSVVPNLQIMQHGAAADRNVYGPYFCLLEPKYLAVIAINCACMSVHVPCTKACADDHAAASRA